MNALTLEEKAVINRDEYNYLVERTSFRCPKRRNHLYCEENDCPRRPHPCYTCTHYIAWMFVFNSKPTEQKREKAFNKWTKNCDACEKYQEWREHPTYYKKCSDSRRAKLKLERIAEGRIVVFNDRNSGFEVTLS